jgi:uncharacterized protein (TIGR03083 family)
MEHHLAPVVTALRHSHDGLARIVAPLDVPQLELPSYAADWSVAQVLSHLGSQAQIFNLFLDAGLSGQDPPGAEAFQPIWAEWDARDARAQAADSLSANEALVRRFESLDEAQRDRFRLKAFGMDVDAAGLARMRLGEHAVHSWDVAVAFDPTAMVAGDSVSLLIDTLSPLAARAGKADGKQRRILISTTGPTREFLLQTGESVTLEESGGDYDLPALQLPAEALVRLVYGRLDPAHTPAVEADQVDLGELRQIFPGF